MAQTLQQLTEEVMAQAKAKGFGTKLEDINVAEKIALIHGEVSEAYEGYRKKDMDGPHGFAMELGDAIQRILHLCAIFNIDAEAMIMKKLESNTTREWDWNAMNEQRS